MRLRFSSGLRLHGSKVSRESDLRIVPYNRPIGVRSFMENVKPLSENHSWTVQDKLMKLHMLTQLVKCVSWARMKTFVLLNFSYLPINAYTFAGTDHCQLPEYGPYSLYTRIRAVRPSTCNVVRNSFGHLIRDPHYFQTLGWIGFIYGLIIGMGPKVFSVPSPPMAWSQGHGLGSL